MMAVNCFCFNALYQFLPTSNGINVIWRWYHTSIGVDLGNDIGLGTQVQVDILKSIQKEW